MRGRVRDLGEVASLVVAVLASADPRHLVVDKLVAESVVLFQGRFGGGQVGWTQSTASTCIQFRHVMPVSALLDRHNF